jgi:hypothetical protein
MLSMDHIRPFLESNQWRELAVFHSMHGGQSRRVFHQFVDEGPGEMLIEELEGNNGLNFWIPLDPKADTARIAAVREFVAARARA